MIRSRSSSVLHRRTARWRRVLHWSWHRSRRALEVLAQRARRKRRLGNSNNSGPLHHRATHPRTEAGHGERRRAKPARPRRPQAQQSGAGAGPAPIPDALHAAPASTVTQRNTQRGIGRQRGITYRRASKPHRKKRVAILSGRILLSYSNIDVATRL